MPLLVTFRRSGEPVPTPVWFGLHEGRVYVESLADAGKVKRLRHDQRVRSLHAPFVASRKARSPRA
jgi:PPOX class probable F420-dependent enzyme